MVPVALLGSIASCAGLGPTGARRDTGNIVDARFMTADSSPERPQTASDIYRALLAPTWGSDCRMLPTDSVYFDEKVRRCGAILGAVAGLARLLLEVEATPAVLVPVPASDRVHWLDSSGSRPCWP
jgi:putative component of membrane protein insertase Oxa1/YidC/SpoIIIJ protein YidD